MDRKGIHQRQQPQPQEPEDRGEQDGGSAGQHKKRPLHLQWCQTASAADAQEHGQQLKQGFEEDQLHDRIAAGQKLHQRIDRGKRHDGAEH